MPIPVSPLQAGDGSDAVGWLHRTLELINRVVDRDERDAKLFGASTEAALRQLQESSGIPVTGVFDDATHEVATATLADRWPFTVYGNVTDADERPVVGAVVVAVDIDLRRHEELGRTRTDGHGEYEVRYSQSDFTRAEKKSADVVVRVSLGEEAIAESATTFNAPPELRVDLSAADRLGPSEFERLEEALAPLLAGAPAAELTPTDVAFLAGETGLPADAWRAYIGALDLATTSAVDLPAAAFYAWQRTGQPETWDALRAVRIGTLRSSLLDAIDRNLVPRSLGNDLEAILTRFPNVDLTELTDLLDAARVPRAVAERLALRADAVDAITDEVLGELVDAGDLSAENAAYVGLAASVQRLVGDAPGVVAAVLDADVAAVPGGRLRASRDLAALDPADWARTLEAAGAPAPEGTTLQAHARTRAIAATSAFPEDALRHRVSRVPDDLAAHVKRLRTLLHKSPDALDRDFDDLDVRGRGRESAREAHTTMRRLVRTHPGLKLDEVLAEQGSDVAAVVSTRIGWVADVIARNPETPFAGLDYLPDTPALTAIDFGDLDSEAQAQVLADLRAHRRMTAVAGNAVAAQELMVAGITSASAIARSSVSELAARTAMETGELRQIHGTATTLANNAALDWFSIYGAARDRVTTPDSVTPKHGQYFHRLSGYTDLLTDQPWCECDDCQSVLSPAAYYVDLMHYIEKHVLADSFVEQPTHPLHLERRRPDLWDLPLSCANTKDKIPTLNIVNEVLERYIREVEPLPAEISVEKHLAEQQASFRQPVTLPIERLDTLLGHFSLSRHDVARSMRSPREVRARARLGLSLRAYELVTTQSTDPTYLTRLFDIETNLTDPDTALGAVETQPLVRSTGLDHDVLAAALTSDFVRQDGTAADAVTITIGKRYPNDVQNNTEVVTNLTLRRLDRLHRFLRLWRTLPWTIAELDHVLDRLRPTSDLPEIVPNSAAAPGTLERITDLLELQADWSIPLEQVLAIVDTFPTQALRASEPLFDLLFNAPGFAEQDGRWTTDMTGRFTHPAWNVLGTPGLVSPQDSTLSRLLAGLQLQDQEFLDLIDGIRADPSLGHRPGTATEDASISMARTSIASLYRHARVRALLRLSVADLITLLQVVPRGSGPAALEYLRDGDDVRALVEAVGWQRRVGVAMRDLAYLTGGPPPAGVPDAAQLVAELPAAATVVATAATRKVILSGPEPLRLLDLVLGSQLGRSSEEVALLRECLATPRASARTAVVRVLNGGTATSHVAAATSLVADIVRMHRLLPRPFFDESGLRFLRQERAAFFGPAPAANAGETLTLGTVGRVLAYGALLTRKDAAFTTAGHEPDVAAVRAAITAGVAATEEQLARALGTDSARIAALAPHLARTGRPFEDLALFGENVALADRLGVGGEALGRMVDESDRATTFDQLARAADDVLGAFRARYPDLNTLAQKLEPYEDVMRGRLRNGLVDHLRTRWPERFSGPDRLSEYFLLDVLVEGCARTSRVVSATSSVQLYLHRVLMNLERSAGWDPTTTPPSGVFARFSSPARRAEASWRKLFQTWKGARMVFLFPHRYLDWARRDDTTPLCSEFEDTLLGGDLSAQNISDAYSAYLTGLDGLAQLQIAGAYHDGQTLHLFGVTQDDAPVYYYRAIEVSATPATSPQEHRAPTFSPWHRIDLSIPVRKVSPCVHEGRLYLFWVENATRPINNFDGGNSKFAGYRHTVRVRYSTLRLDGRWAAPQLLRFEESGGVADARIVKDPIDDSLRAWLWDRAKVLEGQRPDLDKKRGAKASELNQFTNVVDNFAEAVRKLRDAYNAPYTDRESVAVGLLLQVGYSGEAARSTVRWAQRAEYMNALSVLNMFREQQRLIEADLANLVTQLANLDTEITQRWASWQEEVVHVRWDRSFRDHKESLDSYRPDGWVWDRVYPEVHTPPDLLSGVPSQSLIRLTMVPGGDWPPAEFPFVPGDLDAVSGVLRAPLVAEQPFGVTNDFLNFDAGRIRLYPVPSRRYGGQSAVVAAHALEIEGLSGGTGVGIAPTTADVQVVMGQPGSIIVQDGGDSVWMRRRIPAVDYTGLRLGTSLTRPLVRQFWRWGPTGLLAADFQRSLSETRSLIGPIAAQADPLQQSPFHPEHPWLVYNRETFLHNPFLIAGMCNTAQDFAGAQRWLHMIFDPTAVDGQAWRNRELAEADNRTTTLRDILVDRAALDAYRANPFNPHAIARTRLNAHAKACEMKYIDNCLDWGDSLFAQFTTESVNEATMLYVMARDILGPRPTTPGPCSQGAKVRTYRQIRPGLNDVSDFVVELETPAALSPLTNAASPNHYVIPAAVLDALQEATAAPAGPTADVPESIQGQTPGGPDVLAQTPAAHAQLAKSTTVWTSTDGTPLTTLAGGGGTPAGTDLTTITGTGPGTDSTVTILPGGPGSGAQIEPLDELDVNGLNPLSTMYELALDNVVLPSEPRDRSSDIFVFNPSDLVPPKESVFCMPSDQELLGRWDRVADRLYKVRNCMDISGTRRRLELFAPEIDPRLLVRMTAAGLTIDDVLGPVAGQFPAYRFSYLVDKAKEHLAAVRTFGGQLLAALESGDARELEQLRAVHEQNLLTLRRRLAQMEIDAAEDTLDSLRQQRDGVEYRRQHFAALLEAGTLPQERKQQDLQREASQARTAAAGAQQVASLLTLIPDVGAPTAMKFGGSQLGAAGRAIGDAHNAQAAFYDAGAMMAGVEASVRRRDEEWKHQEETAHHELGQLDRNITAAEIRRDIAVHSLEVHERTIEQAEEMFEFFRERFSSLERSRLLVKDLRRLQKVAFDSTLGLAQMVWQAYEAEREDDDPTDDDDLLTGGYWDPQNAGLLAGDKLLVDLQRLERQYIERNTRKLEIEQNFSLGQFAPDQLAQLRLTGECTFSIPEWFFNLSYPGHYRRRLKGVRLTMPCVTGPYTNIGATLRLKDSRIRLTAPPNQTAPLGRLTPVELGHTVSIATSRAQRDGGVFEFGFRDERYLPFEGAGAISDWSLSLPKTLRVFDYTTITDVIIHLDYTADHDSELERRWDAAAELVTLLRAEKPPLWSRFSLRNQLPDAFHRLLTSPPGTEVEFTLDERYFSLFLAGLKLEARAASISILSPLDDLKGASIALARKPVPPVTTAAFVPVTASARPSGDLPGGMREFDCGSVLPTSPSTAGLLPEIVGTYLVKVAAPGALAAASTLAPEALRDVVLRVGYRLATPGPPE